MFIRLRLIYPEELVKEPILCTVCKNFDVVVNIRTASVKEDSGILTLEIEGREEEVEKAIKFLKEKGIYVEPLEGEVFRE